MCLCVSVCVWSLVHLQVVAGGDTTVTGPPQEQAAAGLTPSCIFQDDLGYELFIRHFNVSGHPFHHENVIQMI